MFKFIVSLFSFVFHLPAQILVVIMFLLALIFGKVNMSDIVTEPHVFLDNLLKQIYKNIIRLRIVCLIVWAFVIYRYYVANY